jgi:hypothetical protein
VRIRPLALRRSGPARTTVAQRRSGPVPVQGTLALEWQLPGEVDAVPALTRSLRVVRPDDDVDPAVAEVPTGAGELPDPARWAARLVQAVVEVLAHERPRQQLVRWLSTEVYADLGVHLAATPRRGRTGVRRTVSSIHLCEPADGVVEASAVVVGGTRARAVAVRLEGWDGRWRCTRLAVL